jgi:hypothetical protein
MTATGKPQKSVMREQIVSELAATRGATSVG